MINKNGSLYSSSDTRNIITPNNFNSVCGQKLGLLPLTSEMSHSQKIVIDGTLLKL